VKIGVAGAMESSFSSAAVLESSPSAYTISTRGQFIARQFIRASRLALAAAARCG